MSCASPSTNPSSCDSLTGPGNFHHLHSQPSTSVDSGIQTSTSSRLNGDDSSSPALAQSVPSNQEPHYPESSENWMLFSTKMVEFALKDLQSQNAGNLKEWFKKYHGGCTPVRVQGMTELRETDRKPSKRKAELEDQPSPHPQAKKPAVYEVGQSPCPSTGTTTPLGDAMTNSMKEDENPLKRMEMMTNATVFKTSATIKEVAVDSNEKKDERVKLERLEGIGKDLEAVQAENARLQAFSQNIDRARQQQAQMLSPGMSPYFPGHPAPFPPGPYRHPLPPGMPPPYPGGMPPFYPGRHPMAGYTPFPPGMVPKFPPGYLPMRPDIQMSPNHPDYPKMLQLTNSALSLNGAPGKSPSFPAPPYPGIMPGAPPHPGMYSPYGPPGMPMSGPMGYPRPMPGPMTVPTPQPAPSPLAVPNGGPRSQPPPVAANSPFYPMSSAGGGAPSAPPQLPLNGSALPGQNYNSMLMPFDRPNSQSHVPSFWPGQLSDPNSLPGISMPQPVSIPAASNAEATA